MTKLDVTMNKDEIEYFAETVQQWSEGAGRTANMLEWGSGGSTQMFLDHPGIGSLTSVEHNEEWYNKVTEALKDNPKRSHLDYLFIPPKAELRFYGYGVPTEESPCFNSEYINPQKAFDDLDPWSKDIYLIDGISRGACLATVYAKARLRDQNVLVFIHDYKGREEWYDWATSLYSNVEVVGSTLCKLTI